MSVHYLAWERMRTGNYCLSQLPVGIDYTDLCEIHSILLFLDDSRPVVEAAPARRGRDIHWINVDFGSLNLLEPSSRRNITITSSKQTLSVLLWMRNLTCSGLSVLTPIALGGAWPGSTWWQLVMIGGAVFLICHYWRTFLVASHRIPMASFTAGSTVSMAE